MIRSSNGVRLLSSHLIRDACRSIYEGVFHRTVDSGVWTLSRVRGHATVNPNNRLLSNSSIRGSVSLSRPDYERSNYPGRKELPPVEGVSEKDFRKGFKDWCNKRGRIFSSEGEKDYMFKWFCDNHRYGREFSLGGRPRRALVDHIRKYGNKYTKIASEALLENLSLLFRVLAGIQLINFHGIRLVDSAAYIEGYFSLVFRLKQILDQLESDT
ncbi:hypothetical protein P8452_46199 [Trifolium repens]|nr:hypothetical protein QL285_074090 [Trifolium repens]WJX61065.1 hypothetical protein P8452_46199 [Trifolium repens]